MNADELEKEIGGSDVSQSKKVKQLLRKFEKLSNAEFEKVYTFGKNEEKLKTKFYEEREKKGYGLEGDENLKLDFENFDPYRNGKTVLHYEVGDVLIKNLEIKKYNQMLYYKKEDGDVSSKLDYLEYFIINKIDRTFKSTERQEILKYIDKSLKEEEDDIDSHAFKTKTESFKWNFKTKTLEKVKEIFLPNTIETNYNPEAPRTELLTKFLNEIKPELKEGEEDNWEDVVFEFFGSTLIRTIKYNKLIIFQGDGGNGKSTLLNLLKNTLGKKNFSNFTIQQFSEKFNVEAIIDKLVNVGGDIPENMIENPSIIKMITGGDTFTVDRKYLSAIDITATVKLIFSANDLPRFKDSSLGMQQRIMIIPTTRKTKRGEKEEDKDLGEKFNTKEVKEDFLNRCIEGLKRLLTNKDFTVNKTIDLATKKYLKTLDTLNFWIDEEEINSLHFEGKLRSAVYIDYRNWMTDNKFYAMGSHSFFEKVEKKFNLEKKKIRSGDILINSWVKLKTEEERKKDEENANFIELFTEGGD